MATAGITNINVVVDSLGYLSTGNALVDRRAKRLIDRLAEQRFRSEVMAWAGANEGTLRTRLGIRVEIAGELQAVCEALGTWALVDGDELFPAETFSSDEWEL